MLVMMGCMVVGYGVRNADGSRILEFTDGLNLIICNTLFKKQESKLVLLRVRLIMSLYSRGTKLRFITSRSFQMKNAKA